MEGGTSRRNFIAGVGGALVAAPLTSVGQKSAKGEPSAPFLKNVPALMEWSNVPGLAIATVKDGKLAWSRGFGVLKAGESTPVGSDTIFPAASLSKPVVAYAILRMRDANLIDLDRPLWSYMPYADLPEVDHARTMTARHALSHSSGLQN